MKTALDKGEFAYNSISPSNGESSKENSVLFEEALSSLPKDKELNAKVEKEDLFEDDLDEDLDNLDLEDDNIDVSEVNIDEDLLSED